MHRGQRILWIRIWSPGVAIAAVVAIGAGTESCVFDSKTSLCEQFDLRCKEVQECATDQAICINIGGCGNHRIDKGEVCDDGNVVDGDGCNSTCTSNETCGNGILDMGETCDDGNLRAKDGCSPECQKESMVCGNHI